MIAEFVNRWEARKGELRAQFAEKPPDDYAEIVKAVVRILHVEDEYESPDPERVTEIDHGHYRGTLLYVVAGSGYQPSRFWTVKVGYGSCSGCDALQAIDCYGDGKPNDEQLSDYMTLALHIVQGLRSVGGDE